MIATYRDGGVHVVDSVTSSYFDGKVRNSELLYNAKRHTIIAHTHTYTLKKKHQTLKGDFWVETQYIGNMSSKKVLKTVFNDGKRTWLLKGALKDHKIISEKKKALTKEIKRLKRGSVPASKSDSEGIIICEGTMSCVESIGISNNQFQVKFEKDVDMIDYNSYGKPISTTNEVVAPLASDCKWTHSSILLPDIYYFEDYSFDKIKYHTDQIHAEELYEMSLRIFIKDGTVIWVDAGND